MLAQESRYTTNQLGEALLKGAKLNCFNLNELFLIWIVLTVLHEVQSKNKPFNFFQFNHLFNHKLLGAQDVYLK